MELDIGTAAFKARIPSGGLSDEGIVFCKESDVEGGGLHVGWRNRHIQDVTGTAHAGSRCSQPPRNTSSGRGRGCRGFTPIPVLRHCARICFVPLCFQSCAFSDLRPESVAVRWLKIVSRRRTQSQRRLVLHSFQHGSGAYAEGWRTASGAFGRGAESAVDRRQELRWKSKYSVRITVFCSAIVIDVIVHCHTAGVL